MAKDALSNLADLIRTGLPQPEGRARSALEALFGGRYHKRHLESKAMIRDAFALARDDERGGVPFAGLIHPDNPPSGRYGGTSLVWFPTEEHGSLLDLGVGTLGLSPDEGILTRPGHRRRVAALRRYLARLGVAAWTKPDPSALGVPIPKVARDRFAGFEAAFKRYDCEMYCIAHVPRDAAPALARNVVLAFFDLYAYERGWTMLKEHEAEFAAFDADLRRDLLPVATADRVHQILRRRRFVVLQGPPGTGKTRLAEEVRRLSFGGRGMTVQFHPAVTYEDFVVGLSPDASGESLRFRPRRGWLIEAVRAATAAPYLLVIDEVNRGDLGKVLGEAIYLFEAGEVGGPQARRIRLPHAVDGEETLAIPEHLYVLATMNTADRSIAGMDLAVRRRFAFVPVPPDRSVLEAQGLDLALRAFDRLADVFIEHAPADGLDLLPGHAYFLARDEGGLRQRFRYELIPLLDEYLREGLLGPASTELHAVRDAIEDEAR